MEKSFSSLQSINLEPLLTKKTLILNALSATKLSLNWNFPAIPKVSVI